MEGIGLTERWRKNAEAPGPEGRIRPRGFGEAPLVSEAR